MFGGITAIIGTTGTSGGKGMRGVCVVSGGVDKELCEVDEELGEWGTVICGWKETLAGVGILLRKPVSGLKSDKVSSSCCFLRALGIKFGFSNTGNGFGSRLDLV